MPIEVAERPASSDGARDADPAAPSESAMGAPEPAAKTSPTPGPRVEEEAEVDTAPFPEPSEDRPPAEASPPKRDSPASEDQGEDTSPGAAEAPAKAAAPKAAVAKPAAAKKKPRAKKKAAPKAEGAADKPAPRRRAKKAAPKPPPPVEVFAEATPNPNALKFSCSKKVVAKGSLSFNSVETAEEHPLGKALFAVPGVRMVFAVNDFVTVTKAPEVSWHELAPKLEGVIAAALSD